VGGAGKVIEKHSSIYAGQHGV